MSVVFAVSLCVSALSCLLLPPLLRRYNLLDMPTARSSHHAPTPKGGGVGLALAGTGAAVVAGLPMWLWLPALCLAALSFYNDLRHVPPLWRLWAQCGAAIVLLGGAMWAGNLSWPGALMAPALFFVVGTTNCYNFMDGINGLAGVTGLIVCAGLLLIGPGHVPALSTPMVAVAGALIGFVPFNMPRARLFMGDAGSIFLGFFFAANVCLLARTWAEFLLYAGLLFPFYADETITALERIWRRESLVRPHRRHIYQFLANELHYPHWQVSLSFGLLQIAWGLLAWWLRASALALVVLHLAGLVLWGVGHVVLKYRHGALRVASS